MKNIRTFLIIIAIFIICPFAFSQNVTDVNIRLPFNNTTVKTLIKYLETNNALMFSYLPDEIPMEKIISLSKNDMKLLELLDKMFYNTDIRYTISKKQIILKKFLSTNKAITLNGTITDSITGETLPGTSVYIQSLQTGTTVNNYGFYSITVPPGNYNITYSFIGYKMKYEPVNITSNLTQNINLLPVPVQINEININAGLMADRNVTTTLQGQYHLNSKEIKSLPSLGGQSDIFKSLQFFPGIVPVNDGIAHYSVRGGSFDENLILLDEAPVYNPSHVMGFFSVFNADAVQSVDVMKGFIPARYGGRLSSVSDIRMREGNRNKFSGAGSIDPLSASLTIESPVNGNKTSFLISGRYFNFKAMSGLIEAFQSIVYIPELNNFDFNSKINFYDINFKINHKINSKNQIYLSGYNGSDGFYFAQIDDRSRQTWGNTTSTLRWNHIINEKLFSNNSAIFSRYKYAFNLMDGAENYTWSAKMNQMDIKSDYDYYLNTNNHLQFGGAVSYYALRQL